MPHTCSSMFKYAWITKRAADEIPKVCYIDTSSLATDKSLGLCRRYKDQKGPGQAYRSAGTSKRDRQQDMDALSLKIVVHSVK